MKTRPRHSPIAVWFVSALAGTAFAGTEYLSDQVPSGKSMADLGPGEVPFGPENRAVRLIL